MTDRTPAAARERLVASLQRRGRLADSRTADALLSVPRHRFVPRASVARAYADRPLRIGRGQTISAPHVVAAISELLDPAPDARVLEVGTGCGYHAAVTATLLEEGHVYSVEYDAELARTARRRLDTLGYDVTVAHRDGWDGWPDHAPYDAAYLTCAAPSVPSAVLSQVRPGGRVVGPIGTDEQRLVRLHVDSDGVERETHGAVRFVEMRGGE
ncbi:protein-L-isoaspartate(D-aspartate) O-methyltransferase [Halobaculum sp. MBLA0147]|uniref:protein-L-isoaspartate(D-aspartate) O-methyltransferase n=1 Tax=Halobaculum sp. MBLA0147 TaxID=3079934 RepID=UPI003524FFC3